MGELEGRRQGSGFGLRLLDTLLTGLVVIVALLSVLVVGVLVFADAGQLTLHGNLDRPFAVTPAGSRTFRVEEGAKESWLNYPVKDGQSTLGAQPKLDVAAHVDLTAGSHRYAAAWGFFISLAFVWFGLLLSRRLVRSSRRDGPFDHTNVRRLRMLGGALLIWPLVDRAITRAINESVEIEPAATLSWPGPSLWTCIFGGCVLLALAEVFREGAALRELEQATV